ncbi:HCP-like protein [Neocallimastix californiae]|uniref:HCP-like protein n=1 Tax=Neocallimastix californiae TaxID=1754190 RepID=A0A1Y2DHB6_9FUNG|nr:HCP-like protein [Neocallimastix californiae]|eukprot:ORY58637.1 HCP-like protein [Neocallimastix californiae]
MPSKSEEILEETLKPTEKLYSWSQTEDQVTISFQVLKSFKARDATIDIRKDSILVQIHNEDTPRIKGKLFTTIDKYDSMWQVETESRTNKRIVTIHIEKQNTIPWPLVIRSGMNGEDDIEGMDHQSQYLCGSFYQSEVGDYQKAFKYFESAANLGNTSAQMKLAAFYELGKKESQSIVVEQDLKKAIYWHTKAAEADNPEACYIVGTAYQQGTHFLEKSYSTALKWLERCLESTPDLAETANNIYVATCFQIGLMKLEGGYGIEEDSEGAIKYWKMSAYYKHSQSLYNLGVLYLNKIGKDHNIVKAIRLIQEAISIDSTLDIPAQLQQLTPEQLEQVNAMVESNIKENPDLGDNFSLESMLTPPPSAQSQFRNRKSSSHKEQDTTTSKKSTDSETKVKRKKKKSGKRHHSSQSSLNSTNNKLILATGMLTLAGISAFVMYRVFKNRN